MSKDEEEDDGYESGPFCRHWSDPNDCDEKCKRCGHSCCQHGYSSDESCNEDGCTCEGWVEDEETTEPSKS